MSRFKFETLRLPPEALAEQARARSFLANELAEQRYPAHLTSWSSFDAAFSRRAGGMGFIGMTWPKSYGGRELSGLARFAVTAEMLAAGAPSFAHWIADRQSGPQILAHGSERAKREILPRICRGECFFGIGMSEPNSGSDLAAVRTKATRHDGGWRITGSKIWTSNAHHAHYLIVLARTGDAGESRHGGLTQFIADLAQPGVDIRPIYNLAGAHEFNEVFFDDFFVPDDMMVGREGSGWDMVTRELAFERSGPDRFLSDYRLLVELIERVGPEPDGRQAVEIGRLVAHLVSLLTMSVAVAELLDRGESSNLEAALVKDVGTNFERDVPEVARRLVQAEPSMDREGDIFAQAAAQIILNAPSFTLRGGTREILRGMIARGLGLR
jgi:alkylation response protein AidB-like acyl-CoA dehydrogenase